MKITYLLTGLISLVSFNSVVAQEQSTDTIPGIVDQLRSDVGVLNRLKISGYIQAQAQFAPNQDNNNFKLPSVAGGDFNPYQNNRFGVRRGRIKFAYNATPLSQFVLQLDATEKGIGLKDAYLKFTEPLLKTLSVTAGVFNRPFGYEIEYSSSQRESPERSRITQSLFPQERDLGAMATLQAPKTSRLNFIKLDVAYICGNGINPDFDRFKDVITRLNMSKSLFKEKVKISGGASWYYGGFANQTTSTYGVGTTAAGVKTFIAQTDNSQLNARSLKDIRGVDLQVTADAPWGMFTVRGEYLMGQQPATSGSNVYPTAAPSSATYTTTAATDSKGVTSYTTKTGTAGSDTYIRKVSGFYVYFTQNICQSRHQIVVKYDVYDPNTQVSGSDIGVKGSNFNISDMKYSTLGLGYIFKLDANTKIMAYYDMVKNENTQIAETLDKTGKVTAPGYTSDLHDNIITLRLQYKF